MGTATGPVGEPDSAAPPVSSLGGADGACALPFMLAAASSVAGRPALGAAGADPEGAAGLAWPASCAG